VCWKVWATYPTVGKNYSSGFEEGWLTFEANGERCRLAPIPARWDTADERKLRLLLKAAVSAKKQLESSENATRVSN
jgi:hypothetical protein